MILLFNHA